jgi:hypothetical protein
LGRDLQIRAWWKSLKAWALDYRFDAELRKAIFQFGFIIVVRFAVVFGGGVILVGVLALSVVFPVVVDAASVDADVLVALLLLLFEIILVGLFIIIILVIFRGKHSSVSVSIIAIIPYFCLVSLRHLIVVVEISLGIGVEEDPIGTIIFHVTTLRGLRVRSTDLSHLALVMVWGGGFYMILYCFR